MTTPKDATRPREHIRCRRCGLTSEFNRYVDVAQGRMLGTCPEHFPSIASWGAICPGCDAPRCEHIGPEERCPMAVSDAMLELNEFKSIGVIPQQKALPATEVIDVEVVELTCTCSAPRYDGDDGWDRDCPQHGVEENHGDE